MRRHIAAHFERQRVACSPFPRSVTCRPAAAAGAAVRLLAGLVARHALREGRPRRRRAAPNGAAAPAALAGDRSVRFFSPLSCSSTFPLARLKCLPVAMLATLVMQNLFHASRVRSLRALSPIGRRSVAQTPPGSRRQRQAQQGQADRSHRRRSPRRARAIAAPPLRARAPPRLRLPLPGRKSCANHFAGFHRVAARSDGSQPGFRFARPLTSSLRHHSEGVSPGRGARRSRGGNRLRGASLRNGLSRGGLQHLARAGVSPQSSV